MNKNFKKIFDIKVILIGDRKLNLKMIVGHKFYDEFEFVFRILIATHDRSY